MQRTLVAMLAAGAALAAGASNRGEEKRAVSSQKRGAEPRKRAHAQAKVTVHDSSATPYDQAGGPPLAEVHIRESFSGDFEGRIGGPRAPGPPRRRVREPRQPAAIP